jgi:hypothetical protein
MNPSSGWHYKDLGDALMAHLELDEIATAVRVAQAEEPEAGNLAVFTRHSSEGRLQCAVTAYFSPAASSLAQKFGAVACSRPQRNELALLCGDSRAWRLLADATD